MTQATRERSGSGGDDDEDLSKLLALAVVTFISFFQVFFSAVLIKGLVLAQDVSVGSLFLLSPLIAL